MSVVRAPSDPPEDRATTSSTSTNVDASDLGARLARYQQAWADGDIEGILAMTPPDGIYEASFGPNPWGQRFVGHEEIRSALHRMGVGQPGGARHQYGATYLVGDCAFAMWTNVQDGPSGPVTTMHGADFYRFRNGMVAEKIAYRKSAESSSALPTNPRGQ
jgi:ketosteroid isomerase-like protein